MNKIEILKDLVVVLKSFFSFQKRGDVFSRGKIAIKGFDPVAFFDEGEVREGTKEFTHEWSGVIWYFKNQKNKDLFAANPEQYAPQHGGYCAYGVSLGRKAPTKTNTWTIDSNKLYFNYSLDVKKEWDKDRTVLIEKANEQ